MQKKCNNSKRKYRHARRMFAVCALSVLVPLCAGCEKKSGLVITAAEAAAEEAAETPVSAEAESVPDAPAEQDTKIIPIAVHVCGAVAEEGVYELAAGARVKDAVAAAGGFAPDADRSFVNQAAFLTDGMRLKIPTAAEAAAYAQEAPGSLLSDELIPDAAVTVPQPGQPPHLVNINTATVAELCTLNGVGEARAAEIIRYRETNGAFTRIEDLMKVTGIKEKLFERIRDAITV